MIDSICILGGGTSGLVSALMLRSGYPELKITLIESSNVPIVGVGEGSTEHWKRFMNQAGISVFDIFRETGSTYKIGIKFTNWHGDGTSYFHSLAEHFGAYSPKNGLSFVFEQMISNNVPPEETVYQPSIQGLHSEPLHENFSQYHFDTHKLNLYFHKLCKERSIEIINTEITDVELDENGYVKNLIDTNNKKYSYEFFIDCSGFRRIIGSKLDAKWISKSKELPMNSAIAFPTGYTEDIPSYTESTALSSGWAWRIPTQDRYGNGYVFCDSFINQDQAVDEVLEHYKKLGITDKIDIGKTFKFDAGYVDRYWIKNCLMVGLSGIFVEPLEASSIGTTIQQIFLLLPVLYMYEKNDTRTPNIYNKNMREMSDNIVDFIQLHYLTERQDTDFWKWLKQDLVLTDFNKENIEYFKSHGVHPHIFTDGMWLFRHLNWIQVMHGLRMFDTNKFKDRYQKHLAEYYDPIINFEINIKDENILKRSKFYTTREAINMIKERHENVQYTF